MYPSSAPQWKLLVKLAAVKFRAQHPSFELTRGQGNFVLACEQFKTHNKPTMTNRFSCFTIIVPIALCTKYGLEAIKTIINGSDLWAWKLILLKEVHFCAKMGIVTWAHFWHCCRNAREHFVPNSPRHFFWRLFRMSFASKRRKTIWYLLYKDDRLWRWNIVASQKYQPRNYSRKCLSLTRKDWAFIEAEMFYGMQLCCISIPAWKINIKLLLNCPWILARNF